MTKPFLCNQDPAIAHVVDCVMGSLEGNEGFGIGDYFCVGYDFPAFLDAMAQADAAYKDQKRWNKMVRGTALESPPGCAWPQPLCFPVHPACRRSFRLPTRASLARTAPSTSMPRRSGTSSPCPSPNKREPHG